ncbi:MAG TPA: hypothetical protein VHE30_24240 [Polyangiaceae bacterium]|nr:hypothetical protein [Polyangiaceae bacterium]
MRRFALAITLALFPVVHGGVAHAALTDSEKAVVKTFVKKGALDSASRVRALVGRPDLEKDEVSAVLRDGYAEAPFDDAHLRFTDALLFGPGSAAARNDLVAPVVTALLARAAARMNEVPMEAAARVTEKERAATEELLAIHGFVDQKIANGGSPPPDGHDGALAIREDALGSAARQYVEHLVAHERWMRAPGNVSAELVRVRAQMALALIDLSRGVLGRHEIIGALGLDGSRRALFERTGVFVEAGAAPDARLADVLRVVESVPDALRGVSALLVSKTSPLGLVGRGKVLRVGVSVGAQADPIGWGALWPDEVTPSAPDKALVAAAEAVAELATARALSADPALAEKARAASEHAARAGAVGYLAKRALAVPLARSQGLPAAAPAPAVVLEEAVALLLLDAPRAVDLAVVREAEGRPEPAEQLALALTVLASSGARAAAGRTKQDGGVESLPLSEVKREGALVTELQLGGRRVTVTSDPEGVFSVALDGSRPKLTSLPTFRERTKEADSWDADGRTYTKLFGAPKATFLDDGRFVVEGSHAGFDAVATGEPGADGEISAELWPAGDGGGFVARAVAGDSSYEGVTLLLEPASSQVRLLAMDGKGKARPLADPAKLPPPGPKGYAVSLAVKGDRVTAKVDKVTLSASLTGGPTDGHFGLAVRADARLEVRTLKVKQRAP